MQTDLSVYKSSLEQQHNSNVQLRSLQEKLTREKNELEEVKFFLNIFPINPNVFSFKKLRTLTNRHKNETDELTRRYEQAKTDRDKFEKYLKEVFIH